MSGVLIKGINVTMSLYNVPSSEGTFENTVEIFGNIYYCLHKIDIPKMFVGSLDRFGGSLETNRGQNAHFCAPRIQGKIQGKYAPEMYNPSYATFIYYSKTGVYKGIPIFLIFCSKTYVEGTL